MVRGLALLSGGIDSPVAAHLAIQNNAEIIAVHFATKKITGKESIEKSVSLCKKLGIKKLFVAEVSGQFGEISKKCEHRYYFVLTKRFMLKTAQKIAEKNNCSFLLTGENLGQVSSQTLSNLSVIDAAVPIPVLRPLLGLDKTEIISIARKIGSLEISEGKEMCDALGPAHPATKTDLQTIEKEEEKIQTSEMLNHALSELEVHQP